MSRPTSARRAEPDVTVDMAMTAVSGLIRVMENAARKAGGGCAAISARSSICR